MILIRHFLLFMALIGLLQGPAVAHAGDREDDIKDVMELLPPNPQEKSQTMSEFYDRVSVRLPLLMRLQMAPYLEGKAFEKLPPIKVNGNEATITENGKVMTVKFVEEGKDVFVEVNGRRLTQKQMASVDALFAAVVKIVNGKGGGKSAWLRPLMIPDAQALEGMTIGLIMLGLTAAVGVGMWWWNKRQQEKAQEAAIAACGSQCCFTGSTWAIGCCAQTAGYMRTGSPAVVGDAPNCPVGCPTNNVKCYTQPTAAATGTSTTVTTPTSSSSPISRPTNAPPAGIPGQH